MPQLGKCVLIRQNFGNLSDSPRFEMLLENPMGLLKVFYGSLSSFYLRNVHRKYCVNLLIWMVECRNKIFIRLWMISSVYVISCAFSLVLTTWPVCGHANSALVIREKTKWFFPGYILRRCKLYNSNFELILKKIELDLLCSILSAMSNYFLSPN